MTQADGQSGAAANVRDEGIHLLTTAGRVHENRCVPCDIGVLAARVVVGVGDGLHPVGGNPTLPRQVKRLW